MSATLENLIGADSYRNFLRAAIECQSTNKRTNISSISRRAGFSSRGFIKDVVNGRRRLTAISLTKFKKGLKLSGSWAQLFEYLVALEEPDVNFQQLSEVDLRFRITKLKTKLTRQITKRNHTLEFGAIADIFSHPEVYLIYASLGNVEDGASLSEVVAKANCPAKLCKGILDTLIKKQMVIFRSGRYLAAEGSVDLFELGKQERFRRMYGAFTQDLSARSRQSLKSEDEFFYCGALSVKRSDMKKLKARIREALTEFLDEAQDDSGDKIAKIVLGFYL